MSKIKISLVVFCWLVGVLFLSCADENPYIVGQNYICSTDGVDWENSFMYIYFMGFKSIHKIKTSTQYGGDTARYCECKGVFNNYFEHRVIHKISVIQEDENCTYRIRKNKITIKDEKGNKYKGVFDENFEKLVLSDEKDNVFIFYKTKYSFEEQESKLFWSSQKDIGNYVGKEIDDCYNFYNPRSEWYQRKDVQIKKGQKKNY